MDAITDLANADVGTYLVALFNGSVYELRLGEGPASIRTVGTKDWFDLAEGAPGPVFGETWDVTVAGGTGPTVVDSDMVVTIDRRD